MRLATMTPIQLVYDILFCGMWILVMNFTYPYRYSRRVTYLLELAWLVFNIVGTRSLPFMSGIRTTLGYLLFFVLCILVFDAPWPKVLFNSAMILLLVITNELIGAALYYPPEAMAGTPELLSTKGQLLFLGPNLATGAVLFFLYGLLINRMKFDLSSRDWLLFAIFPISQYLLMFGWLDAIRTTADQSRVVFFIIAILAAVIADVGLFLAIRHIAQRAQLKAENAQLALQVEAQEKHYADLTAQYESIRRMRHDIANHLDTMQALLESSRGGEAAAYLSELKAGAYDTTLGICENPIIDAFLHNKIESARASGVEIRARVSLSAGLPVSNVDLVRAFGNLLDNALEACAGIAGACVDLRCAQLNGCLVIRCENPVNGTPAEKSRRIPELDRGVGSRVLKDLAEKYGGSLKQEQQNGIFRAELILNMDK